MLTGVLFFPAFDIPSEHLIFSFDNQRCGVRRRLSRVVLVAKAMPTKTAARLLHFREPLTDAASHRGKKSVERKKRSIRIDSCLSLGLVVNSLRPLVRPTTSASRKLDGAWSPRLIYRWLPNLLFGDQRDFHTSPSEVVSHLVHIFEMLVDQIEVFAYQLLTTPHHLGRQSRR
jgi:hypothetical protein